MIVSAHDGYPRLLRSGADFIEVDVRRDAGGVIVLAHDDLQPGVRYPTLDECLRDLDDSSGLHLDLKEDGFELELVTRMLERLPPESIVATPDFGTSIRLIKERFPEIRVSPIDFVAVEHGHVEADAYPDVPVWVWTVDDTKEMKRYFQDPRIEGIITNRPDLALKLRKARW